MRRLIIIFLILTAVFGLIQATSKSHPDSPSDSQNIPSKESVDQNKPIMPIALTNYPPEAPAPNTPLVMWSIPTGCVYFEIEFLSDPPENPNGISPSIHRFFSSRAIYTNGYSMDLSTYPKDYVYWRVRGLDLDGNPVGVFSDATLLHIDHSLRPKLKPVSNTGYKAANLPMPLYPVYAWIPISGAAAYEIEVTSAPPENPNGITPSKYRLRVHSLNGQYDYFYNFYDEMALGTPGTYYWRVRGLDKAGGPVGVFSDAEEFTVSLDAGSYAATFGDSTTQGGGDMIYSPANIECDYQTYLSFPTMNLGRSADNLASMLLRFDSDVLPFHPRYLIVLGGIPDLIDEVPAPQIINELAAIRDKCILHGIRPIFLTLYPVNPANIKRTANRDSVNDWQEKLKTVNAFLRKQKYCIDIEPYFLGPDNYLPSYLSIDGIHLGIEGKKLMAKVINDNWSRVTQ